MTSRTTQTDERTDEQPRDTAAPAAWWDCDPTTTAIVGAIYLSILATGIGIHLTT